VVVLVDVTYGEQFGLCATRVLGRQRLGDMGLVLTSPIAALVTSGMNLWSARPTAIVCV
jgi:hypothetical protein